MAEDPEEILEAELLAAATAKPGGGARDRAANGEAIAPRPEKAEQLLRVNLVASMLLANMRRGEIHAFIEAKLLERWNNISTRSIDRLIASANKLIEKEGAKNIAREKSLAAMRLDDLYKRALTKGLVGTALRCQRAIIDFHGIGAPKVHRLANDPTNPLIPVGGAFTVLIQEVVEE